MKDFKTQLIVTNKKDPVPGAFFYTTLAVSDYCLTERRPLDSGNSLAMRS